DAEEGVQPLLDKQLVLWICVDQQKEADHDERALLIALQSRSDVSGHVRDALRRCVERLVPFVGAFSQRPGDLFLIERLEGLAHLFAKVDKLLLLPLYPAAQRK